MLRSRSRLIAAPLAAAALTLSLGGLHTATAADSGSGTGPAPRAAAACLADATTLLGDLDGDGNADRISNPGHTGTEMTVQWGKADGTFGAKQAVRDLIGAKKGEDASAAVADFHNDGTLDIVVNIVERSGGDDSSEARLSEFRPGPLNRADLSSPDAVTSDVGQRGEVRELAIAQYNDDAYPDLAVLNNPGDGQMDRDPRLSKPGGGLDTYSYDAYLKYGEFGSWSEPPAMPTDGWSQFYKSCS